MRRAILVLLALAGSATAGPTDDPTKSTQTYRVKKDDTLALIAAEFYGDRAKQIFIMVENGMQHPRPLKPGEVLRIPTSREIITNANDTFKSLAATYLGDERRAKFIADYNSMTLDDDLAAGTALALPFAVTHQTQGPETPQMISLAYFGDASQAERIRTYNNLEPKVTLEKGREILVPVFSVRTRPEKTPPIDAESRARRERRTAVVAKAATAIPTARQAWRAGDFAAVKRALAEIEPDADYLDTQSAVDIGLLLGSVHVAANDSELATAAFKRVLLRKPGLKLRAFDHSPKVIAVWKNAGGQTE